MSEINSFDFRKYDIGGTDATSNDGKLTGEEAKRARADGWTIWDGFSEENSTPENINQTQNNNTKEGSWADKIECLKLPQWIADIIRKNQPADSAEFVPLQPNEIPNTIGELNEKDTKRTIEDLVRKSGVNFRNKPIEDVITDLTGKNDDKLTTEQKEARAELNNKQSSIGMTYADAKAKVAEILQKYPECFDEIEIPIEQRPDENGRTVLTYRKPIKTKIFNPDKLPEPAKTQFKEAQASMAEIENANSTLAKKGGIDITEIKEEFDTHTRPKITDVSSFEGIGFEHSAQAELTEVQKSARSKLDSKVSSTGISYKDAKATIENITKQYKNNPDYQSMFEQEQPEYYYVYFPPVKAFDPYKLKGADKEVYFKAMAAINEIENANYALLIQAGLEKTKLPEIPKSGIVYFNS